MSDMSDWPCGHFTLIGFKCLECILRDLDKMTYDLLDQLKNKRKANDLKESA